MTGGAECYTTPQVVGEVSHRSLTRASIQGLIEAGRLVVEEPSKQVVEKVTEFSTASGDVGALSEADVSILALALQLSSRFDVTVLSDDYAVENVAKLLGVRYASVMAKGIRVGARWLIYCGGCGKVFTDARHRFCDVCGSRLRRKLRARRPPAP